MTKKHFEKIARILKDYNEGADDLSAIHAHTIALLLARYFLSVNPEFSRLKFLRACGVKI